MPENYVSDLSWQTFPEQTSETFRTKTVCYRLKYVNGTSDEIYVMSIVELINHTERIRFVTDDYVVMGPYNSKISIFEYCEKAFSFMYGRATRKVIESWFENFQR